MGEYKRIHDIEEGYSITEVTTELMNGVFLHVFDGIEASITVGKFELEFTYDETAKRLFGRLNEGVSAMELLAILARQ